MPEFLEIEANPQEQAMLARLVGPSANRGPGTFSLTKEQTEVALQALDILASGAPGRPMKDMAAELLGRILRELDTEDEDWPDEDPGFDPRFLWA